MEITLKNIDKSYRGRTILDQLNLVVDRGEFHVLLGPSGSGKSTVLSIIAGLSRQDGGEVFIGSQKVDGVGPDKRSIGFVFQDYALFPHLNAFDNIAYGLRVRRIGRPDIGKRVEDILKKLNLLQEKHLFPSQMSGGQKQRIALARALVTEPKVLLMDEPPSHLDPLSKEKVGIQLKRLQRESGITTIYVTHNQEEALSFGDSVSVLNHGKIEQIEPPRELFDHPKTEFVARFLGADNVLKVSVVRLVQQMAILQVHDENMKEAFRITVKRYPIFDKKTQIDLCIHPGKISLVNAAKTVDNSLNKIKGEIINKMENRHVVRAEVDVGGIMFHVAIPREQFCFHLYEPVWVCFDSDAPHPLCGKPFRAAGPLRKCASTLPPFAGKFPVFN